jgi:CheY-like chemotaxis protein
MKFMHEERNLENSINLSIAERNSSFLPFTLDAIGGRLISPAFHRNCGCSPVLIVDDQPINTLILSEFCSRINIKSDTVDNGEKAIHKCLEQQHKSCWDGYELILMDLNMPVMDGFCASENILNLKKNRKLSSSLEIVAVTAFASEEQKDKCLKSGINKFWSKPISFDNLKKLIECHSE